MPRENLVLRLRGVVGGDCCGATADVGEGDVALDAGLGLESVESPANRSDMERLLLDRYENRLGRGTAPSQRGQRIACSLSEDRHADGAQFDTRILLDLRLARKEGSDSP